MRPSPVWVFVVALASCAPTAHAPPPSVHPPFSVEDARKVLPALAALLVDDYVFPETGRRYAAMLQSNLAAGRYARFPDAGAFAEKVTADLQAVSPDKHLVLIAPRTDRPGPASTPASDPPPVGKSGWMGPGVAYLELHSFPSDPPTLDKLRTFLAQHAGAKTLIIDLVHEHAGGWVGEADLLFSQLYASPTDLVAIEVRQAVDQRMGGLSAPSIRKLDAPPGVVRYLHSVTPAPGATLHDTRVYVLVSNRTISAGEHLAFALQRTHRATLIGERTRGAGNVETEVPIGVGYSAVIPFARAFDPRTGKGWEGVGVVPDIQVPPEKALDEALRLSAAGAPPPPSRPACAPQSPHR